ncbi:hypothetical protein BS47DRAFT_980922 [Hydnum rufescens UP504]|uniref:Uncharacterized protein n=1 Tax=Hydnum rufescens UP504 TaxID=1448309 RepID=A0A9P6DW19_9AGAM|nr:hypothetical protein BS47DRAFT_980922 [Hydnum rufescens UP504]
MWYCSIPRATGQKWDYRVQAEAFEIQIDQQTGTLPIASTLLLYSSTFPFKNKSRDSVNPRRWKPKELSLDQEKVGALRLAPVPRASPGRDLKCSASPLPVLSSNPFPLAASLAQTVKDQCLFKASEFFTGRLERKKPGSNIFQALNPGPVGPPNSTLHFRSRILASFH